MHPADSLRVTNSTVIQRQGAVDDPPNVARRLLPPKEKRLAMAFEEMQHRVTTASALGLLLIASPCYAQTVAATTKEFTMTS